MLLAVGLAALFALGLLGAYGVYQAVSSVPRASCLPGDFPRYPGSRTTGLYVSRGPDVTTCDMTIDSAGSASQVTEFYASRMDEGDWQVLGLSPTNGTITFQRRSSSSVRGQLQVLGRGVQSTIQIHLAS